MEEPLPRPSGSLQIGDEQLARQITDGSDRAFSALYERYHELLYRYCRSILRSEADAHDAVQSAFTRALEALRRDRRDAPLRPWLFRIAHNESVSMLRRHKTARELSFGLGPLSVAVDERVGHREQVGLLLDDLQELAPRQRGAIVMRELGGLSHEEIAGALGLSVNGARQAIFEARSALNEFAEGRAMACENVRREIAEGGRRVMRRRPIRAHLRDCAACSAFAAGIRARRVGLKAFVPPTMAAPARLIARLFGSGSSGITGASSAGGSFLTGGFTNLGGVLTAKSIGALALGLTAVAGTGTVVYGLSERSGAAPPRSIAHAAPAAMASVQASLVPVPARAGGARAGSNTRARGAAPLIRFVLPQAGQPSERAGASGGPTKSRHKRVTIIGGSRMPRLTTQRTSPVAQNGAAGSSNGSSGQTHAQSVTTGSAGQPAAQTVTTSSGQSAGQTNPNGQGNGDGQGAGSANGQENGNANGQGNGNGNGQGNGPATGQGNANSQGNGNANGQGNGNAGKPPGLSGSRGGNGNAGNRSHGG